MSATTLSAHTTGVLTMPAISKILIAAAVLLSIAWVSSQDTYEEQREAMHYQNMVCAGHWPDYKNENPEC